MPLSGSAFRLRSSPGVDQVLPRKASSPPRDRAAEFSCRFQRPGDRRVWAAGPPLVPARPFRLLVWRLAAARAVEFSPVFAA